MKHKILSFLLLPFSASLLSAGTIGDSQTGVISHKEALTGQRKGLIILVEFPKRTATQTPAVKFSMEDARSFYDKVANQKDFSDPSGFTHSVYDYFFEQSRGQLEFTFDVVGPYKLGNAYNYYGADEKGLQDAHIGKFVYDACRKADADVDFSKYDADGDGKVDRVFILYAGQGQNVNDADPGLIWPQEGSLNAVGSDQAPFRLDGVTIDVFGCSNEIGAEGALDGIGTLCHEFSHCLGLPDMYDKGTAFGTTSLHYGTYVWDIMNMGNYLNGGFTPAAYTAQERMYLGWLLPIELKDDTDIVNMRPITDGGDTYIIYNDRNRNEFFLLENRQKVGTDKHLYGHGLMITHVNFSEEAWEANNVNTTTERCSIVAADNSKERTTDDVAGDLYPCGGNNSFGNATTPAATLVNPNTDGSFLLNKEITDITQNADGTISFSFRNHNLSSGINEITDSQTVQKTIYSINGTYMGKDMKALPKGIYIVNGKKVIK